jgi:hypothetical protein
LPHDWRESALAVDTAADAKLSLLNGGYLRIYSGPRPLSPDMPATGLLLVELRWADPAFASSRDGQALASPVEASVAGATGEAAWFRALSAGQRAVFDGSAGSETDSDLALASALIAKGVVVKVEEFTYGSKR